MMHNATTLALGFLSIAALLQLAGLLYLAHKVRRVHRVVLGFEPELQRSLLEGAQQT